MSPTKCAKPCYITHKIYIYILRTKCTEPHVIILPVQK